MGRTAEGIKSLVPMRGIGDILDVHRIDDETIGVLTQHGINSLKVANGLLELPDLRCGLFKLPWLKDGENAKLPPGVPYVLE